MKIIANVRNSRDHHQVNLFAGDMIHSIQIPSKTSGLGSGVNGEELLFLALATSYCNELYSQADKKGITVISVEVKVEGDIGREGEQDSEIIYSATVKAEADEREILEVMYHTDAAASIQNILRKSSRVTLHKAEAIRAFHEHMKPDILKSVLHPFTPAKSLTHISEQVDAHHPLFI